MSTDSSAISRRPGRRYLTATFVIAAVAVTYYPVLRWLIEIWGSPLQPFVGYVAPVVTAVLLWDKRERLAEVADTGSSWGLPVLGVALGILVLSTWMHVNVAAAFSLVLTIWALVLLVSGAAAARVAAFPVGFLLLMLPWAWLRDALTFPLRLLSTRMAAWLPAALGMPTEVSGTDIWLGEHLVRVDLECSGLSYTISLLGTAMLLIYLGNTSKLRAAALLVAVLPLSMLANIIRIDLTILFMRVFGPEASGGIWHSLTGIIVFVLVLVMLLALEAVICRPSGGAPQSPSSQS